MYYIVAFRESGPVSMCPIGFTDLEAAKYCAELALHHFGDGWTVAVEEEVNEPEPQLRSADHFPA